MQSSGNISRYNPITTSYIWPQELILINIAGTFSSYRLAESKEPESETPLP